ncbi:hypothetical protein I79_011672 [Cricetulus griseus]|uniref:Uncharacterized protein n=1 Tax=Cricetulus griseus TaxID=10029 RepID=G3HLS8_CRIGR|nr:hypothetical protein I79_011672 [Cricetulus griseus]
MKSPVFILSLLLILERQASVVGFYGLTSPESSLCYLPDASCNGVPDLWFMDNPLLTFAFL